MALGWRRGYLQYKRVFLNISAFYNQRQEVKAFLESILSLMTIAVFATFALRPTLLTIAKLYKEIQTKEEAVVKLDQKARDLVQAQSIYSQEQNRITLLESAVPEKPYPELFARQVEGLIGKHGIELLGLSIGKATLLGETRVKQESTKSKTITEDAGSISFSLSAKGKFLSLSTFLSDLESLRRPIKTDTFSISLSETEGEDMLVLAITGQVPYFKGMIKTSQK